MEIVRLRDADNFVSIHHGNEHYYGGNQAWYGFTVGRFAACGTVAVANAAAYLAIHNSKYRPLYRYRVSKISKSDFVAHMNEVYQYVAPIRFPFLDPNAPPIKMGSFSFGWSFGIWSTRSLAKGFIEFARSRGVKLNASFCTNKGDKKTVSSFIKRGLSKNSPVLLLIGFRPELNNCQIIYPDRTRTHSCNRHWVTITEFQEDKNSGQRSIKVSTWGGYTYLSLDDLMLNRRLYRRLVYFS